MNSRWFRVVRVVHPQLYHTWKKTVCRYLKWTLGGWQKWIEKSPLGFPRDGIQPLSSPLAHSSILYSHLFIFPPISPTFFSLPSKKLSMEMTAKWQAFGVCWFVFPAGSCSFLFLGVQGISNTPKIISPFAKSHGIVFNLAFYWNDFPHLWYVTLFSHVHFISLQRTLDGKQSVLIGFFLFFEMIPRFSGSWVVLAAAQFYFCECRASKITFPFGKSHGIVFNLAFYLNDFPHLWYFPLFLLCSLHSNFDGKRVRV